MSPYELSLWVLLVLMVVGWMLTRLPKRTEVSYNDVTLIATMTKGMLLVSLHYRGARSQYIFRSPRQFEIEDRYNGIINCEPCTELAVMVSGLKARMGLACQACQESDAMYCKQCNLMWDANDPLPPHCAKVVGQI